MDHPADGPDSYWIRFPDSSLLRRIHSALKVRFIPSIFNQQRGPDCIARLYQIPKTIHYGNASQDVLSVMVMCWVQARERCLYLASKRFASYRSTIHSTHNIYLLQCNSILQKHFTSILFQLMKRSLCCF